MQNDISKNIISETLSASNTGYLNNFAINDFPDPILPIIPILII